MWETPSWCPPTPPAELGRLLAGAPWKVWSPLPSSPRSYRQRAWPKPAGWPLAASWLACPPWVSVPGRTGGRWGGGEEAGHRVPLGGLWGRRGPSPGRPSPSLSEGPQAGRTWPGAQSVWVSPHPDSGDLVGILLPGFATRTPALPGLYLCGPGALPEVCQGASRIHSVDLSTVLQLGPIFPVRLFEPWLQFYFFARLLRFASTPRPAQLAFPMFHVRLFFTRTCVAGGLRLRGLRFAHERGRGTRVLLLVPHKELRL